MSQEKRILKYLESGKTITPLEALNLFGCFRLGARIWSLRRRGYEIKDVSKERYSEYKLIQPEQTELFC